jgi:uncharacterized membrane protein YphA (DoxX/SURF4 family)
MALLVSRTIVGMVFVLAGVSKAANFHTFDRVVDRMNLLPARLRRPLLLLVLSLEVLAGVFAFSPWPRVAAVGALGLLAVFCVVLAVTMLRGRYDENCGCFGRSTSGLIGWDLVLRNVGIGFLALAMLVEQVAFTLTLIGIAAIGVSLAWHRIRSANRMRPQAA